MNKSKWNSEHYSIHYSVFEKEQRIKSLERRRDAFIVGCNSDIARIRKDINTLRDKCHHIDDGGPFIATCSVCGWADSFGGI